MRTLCAILLTPFVILILLVLCTISLPMMIIGLSFLFMGDEEGYEWWTEHSPLVYVIDRLA
jgi:hypothetical protein